MPRNQISSLPKTDESIQIGGGSVQLTAGSRGVRISFSSAGYTMFGGGMRVLATHSIRQFPLHFPSHASPPGSERALLWGMIDRLTEVVRCYRMEINVEEANIMISMELLPVRVTRDQK